LGTSALNIDRYLFTMKLTALEIKQQKFERSLRGFDPAEVQAFLSVVSSEWEHMVAHNRELENQIQEMREKLDHYRKVEEALHETLQTAKESAEQRINGAKAEARNRIQKAELEADSIVNEAQQQRQAIRQSTLRLLDRRDEIIRGIRSYLDLAQESLEAFETDNGQVFNLPNEEEEDITIKKSSKNTIKNNNAPEKSSEKHQTVTPGVDDLDDIIDDIE